MRFLLIRNMFSLANKITFLLLWIKCIPPFILAQCEYSTNIPIYLTLFPNPFTNRTSPLFFSTFLSFLAKIFFFHCFYWLFIFQFYLVLFRFNLTFVSFGYLCLALLQLSTGNDLSFSRF